MLERVWDKLDKFYLILAVVLSLMAVMLVVAFRGIFSAYLNAYEINQKDMQVDVKVEKEPLEEVYKWVTNKESLPLQIRE